MSEEDTERMQMLGIKLHSVKSESKFTATKREHSLDGMVWLQHRIDSDCSTYLPVELPGLILWFSH